MSSRNEAVVGFVLKGFPRLSETFVINEILLLEQLGHKIHIFALRNPNEKKVHQNVKKIKAQVSYIPDYFWPNLFYFLAQNCMLFANNPMRYLRPFLFALTRSLKTRDSSTIKRFAQAAILVKDKMPVANIANFHAHFSHDPTTVAFFASWLTGLKYSFSAHAKDIYCERPDFLKMKLKKAEFAVTCTGFNCDYLQGIAEGETPVHRTYHGIDLSYFKPEKSFERNGRPPMILSIGRFVEKKGFPVLLDALALVKGMGVDFTCEIIGGGPLREQLEKKIAELKLEQHINLHGEMAQSEIFDFYKRAQLFALACEVLENGDRDGIPNVLVEAQAMEIPVVSTHISGIPELIENDESGILVEPKHPQALAEAIARILKTPTLKKNYVRNGRRKVETDFNNQENVKNIGKLLRDITECV